MDSATVLKSLEAVSLVVLTIIYFVNKLKDAKDISIRTVLDIAVSTVEEAVAFSEDKNRLKKRECAVNIGKQLKKEAVEISKDPIKVEKFMQDGLLPMREIAHGDARNYIIKAVDRIKDASLKAGVSKILNENTIDQAIHMQVQGPKCGVQQPIKSLLFREM